MHWPLTFRLWRGNYYCQTSRTRRITTWLLVTSPILTALTIKLRKKRWLYAKRGLRIQITQSSKRWWPSVRFSLYFSRFLGLMVTRECEQSVRTSAETNRSMLPQIALYARNWDSDRLLPWISSERQLSNGLWSH